MAAKAGSRKRTSGGRSAGRGGNGRPLAVTDNRTPEEIADAERKAREEREAAEGIQLISIVARVKKQQPKIDAARDALKAEQDAMNDIFRAAKLQSKEFTRERIAELVKDSKPDLRRNVEEAEATRYRFRRLMGLPVGLSDQERELEARLPDVEREAGFWFQAGYNVGVVGEPCMAPEACVRAGHDNKFAEGHTAGQAVLVVNRGALSGKPKATPPPEETADAKRKREKAEEAAAKASLANLKGDDSVAAGGGDDTVSGPALDPVQAAVRDEIAGAGEDTLPSGAADDFVEATPEELAAQKPRQAVQEVRDAAADTAEAV